MEADLKESRDKRAARRDEAETAASASPEPPGSEGAPGGEASAIVVGDAAPAAAGDAAPIRADDTTAPVDFKDRWLRAEAELQNYRRRAGRDLDEARRDAEERVMLEMISALDDLERALGAGREAGAPEAWLQGVQLVAQRMGETLARLGVSVLHQLDEPFDPELHEALLEVDAPDGVAPGAVVQVVLRGYRRGSRVLRAARVVVARRSTPDGA